MASVLLNEALKLGCTYTTGPTCTEKSYTQNVECISQKKYSLGKST